MSVKSNILGDTEMSFFKQNPTLRYYDAVLRHIENEGEESLDKKMWAFWMAEDPDSTFRTLSPEERRLTIAKNFLKREQFDWDKYDDILKLLPKVAMTKAKKRFKMMDDAFDNLLDKLTEEENTRAISDILSKMGGIYKSLDMAEKMMDSEKEKKDVTRGDQKPGLFNE